ncbi:MAG: hypothetical protein OXC41_01875 [Gammaproteobacteria bacterium]|nr:hypothetical protein [Gammaproteobacteria bacterium]
MLIHGRPGQRRARRASTRRDQGTGPGRAPCESVQTMPPPMPAARHPGRAGGEPCESVETGPPARRPRASGRAWFRIPGGAVFAGRAAHPVQGKRSGPLMSNRTGKRAALECGQFWAAGGVFPVCQNSPRRLQTAPCDSFNYFL